MIKGFDCAAVVSAEAAVKMRSMGYDFAIRYCVPETYNKALTKAEVDALHAAGLAVGLCWETTADRAKSGAAGGLVDGQRAKACAQALGAPDDTVIFFAVDFNANANDFSSVAAYMVAAASTCRPYRLGIYGSHFVVTEMEWNGIGEKYWQCVAWSSGKWAACSNIQQREWNVRTGVVTVDNNYAFDLDGLWGDQPDCPYREPTKYVKMWSVGDDARWVQWMLKQRHGYILAVDGIFLKKSDNCLRAFQKKHNLVADGICGPLTREALKK